VVFRQALLKVGAVVDQYGVAFSFLHDGREGFAFLIRQILDVGHKAGAVVE
jgi:hypothetical protein